MKQFTNTETSVIAAISPDGKLVAHVEEQNGKQRLVVTSASTSGWSIAVPPEDGVKYLGITFSRDGAYLYFTRVENNGPGNLYRLAWPGNNPVQIKTGVDSPISLSPNGDRFAFVRYIRETQYLLIVSTIDGSNEEVLATRTGSNKLSVHGPAWSPDGNTVVCPQISWEPYYHEKLVAFDVNNKSEREIPGQSWFQVLQVGWREDMTSLVINARASNSSPFGLWRIQLPDGAAEQITRDLGEYQGVSIAGGNIVTIKTIQSWDLWVSKRGNVKKMTHITSGGGFRYGLTWTSRGKIVYSSLAQEKFNILRINPDGSDPVQLTIDAGDNYNPAASAYGRYIVFTSDRDKRFNIWRMNADDGSDPVQLTFTDANFYPSCSSDNQWVAFDNQTDSKMSVWKVPLQGGQPVKIGDQYRMPVFSPDNQYVACRYNEDSDASDVAIFPAQGGPALRYIKVPKQEAQVVRWLRDGRQLTYVKNVDGYSNIWSIDLDTGAEKQLTNFNSDQIYAYAWSPDYKQVASQRGTKISDVTIISER